MARSSTGAITIYDISDGQLIWAVYSNDGGVSDQSLTAASDTTHVAFIASATEPSLPVSGVSFVPYGTKTFTYSSDTDSIPVSGSIGDVLIDYSLGNASYRAAIVGADAIVSGEWEAITVTADATGAVPTSVYSAGTTTIDGGYLTTGSVSADRINVNSSISILSDSGNIRSGISYSGDSFPENTESITTEGFWLGRDTGKGKFIVGSKDQHLQWDGSALSLKGKLLTGDNIISVDGGSVSTQSFRVTSADIIDGGHGEITNGSQVLSGVTGVSGSDLTYEFEYQVSPSQVGKHFFPSISGNSNYTLADHEVSFSLIDPGTGLSFYEDQDATTPHGYMYVDQNTNTSARYADDSIGRPVKGSGAERYMYRATAVPYQKMGKSITFDNEQKAFFKVLLKAVGAFVPSWTALSLNAYASGTEEYFTISTNSTGVSHTFNNTYESIQNVQITPGSNGAVWFTDLENTSVKIHSNAASTCHVRAIGY